jgi:hypothetical protein
MLLVGETVAPLFTTTGAVLWVGSGSVAHDSLDNHLKGTSVAATMLTGYPSRAVNVLTTRAVYTTNEANFPWMEWGVKNATTTVTSTAGNTTLLNRMVEDLGIKTNAAQWQLTASLTLTT